MTDPVAFLKTLIAAQRGGESAVQHLVADAQRRHALARLGNRARHRRAWAVLARRDAPARRIVGAVDREAVHHRPIPRGRVDVRDDGGRQPAATRVEQPHAARRQRQAGPLDERDGLGRRGHGRARVLGVGRIAHAVGDGVPNFVEA